VGVYPLHREQQVLRVRDGVFEFLSRPENLEDITPPWLNFRILEAPDEIRGGSLIRNSLRWGVVPLRWTREIVEWNPPRSFGDTQISGHTSCGVISTNSKSGRVERWYEIRFPTTYRWEYLAA
jgi:ligand-binding SRPBCC domain-containing protein